VGDGLFVDCMEGGLLLLSWGVVKYLEASMGGPHKEGLNWESFKKLRDIDRSPEDWLFSRELHLSSNSFTRCSSLSLSRMLDSAFFSKIANFSSNSLRCSVKNMTLATNASLSRANTAAKLLILYLVVVVVVKNGLGLVLAWPQFK